MAGWQSGHAAACKAVYAGSIPTPASKLPKTLNQHLIVRNRRVGSNNPGVKRL